MASRVKQEQRRYPRLENSLYLSLGRAREEFKTYTKNISACGVLCKIYKWLPLMTKLKVIIFLPFRKIVCTGVIVRIERAENAYNVAIFFSEINHRDRAALAGYVRARVDKQMSQA